MLMSRALRASVWRGLESSAHRTLRVQISSLSDAALTGTDERERGQWRAMLKRARGLQCHDDVLDWVENKPHRVLLLCRQHLVYVRWDGVAHASSRVRWCLHLEHISSVTKVAHTIVVMCSETVQLGPLRLDVPRRRCLASESDSMAELLLHRINQALDAHFKRSVQRRAQEHGAAKAWDVAQVRAFRRLQTVTDAALCWLCDGEQPANIASASCACRGPERHATGCVLQRISPVVPLSLYDVLQPKQTVADLRTRTLSASGALSADGRASGAAAVCPDGAEDVVSFLGDADNSAAAGHLRARWKVKAKRLKAKAVEASTRVAAVVSHPKATWYTWKRAHGAIAPLVVPKHLDTGGLGSPVRTGALSPVGGAGCEADVVRLIRDDLAAATTPEECVFATDLSCTRAQVALDAWHGPQTHEYTVLRAIAQLCRAEVQSSNAAAVNSCSAALRIADTVGGEGEGSMPFAPAKPRDLDQSEV